jgi:hypothetical protein
LIAGESSPTPTGVRPEDAAKLTFDGTLIGCAHLVASEPHVRRGFRPQWVLCQSPNGMWLFVNWISVVGAQGVNT